ncbi:uncharacterized protein LOC106558823 isoform X1 [Canis lupus familiaris]|uniref:uncharacterized protein LOC106558823 isoform X1 n=1 Tax=Canis lupus familiaris TaxID=9615 RepID=UPI0018F6707C|nr:uncharacterized protein LOC106558823 isoform X1 [Canis lupus familiaris]XP_038375072.1 uncharacterized protein LOC106558823 isoform X1 [Canis lupus familiaris]XP_038393163.1 uncharacterized protein LOC106558823 isoform X1 [Canis lupus familiaris]XP_038393164.1 uncharacterized protein LOC106558823 isoform X1 [Canis lupus familiaris]XP_038521857.1 uncharacterized protein LOC106558823 isoform X1 [Canis lupus familiaris]XP_038521858.1 uncharacterized protein LOC106558823 isoform X1 [Canis lupus
MKDPAGGVCEEEAEEEGGKTEEERSPRGGCVRGEGEPRAASGDPALPRGRDAGPWEGGRDLADIACSRPQLNPRLLPAFPGQGIFSLAQLPSRQLPPSWRRTTPVLTLALEESCRNKSSENGGFYEKDFNVFLEQLTSLELKVGENL